MADPGFLRQVGASPRVGDANLLFWSFPPSPPKKLYEILKKIDRESGVPSAPIGSAHGKQIVQINQIPQF